MTAALQLYADRILSANAQSIRILDLHALPVAAKDDRREPLQGSLRVADLDSMPIFDALSYLWGEQSAEDPTIRIDGVDHPATRNCYDALLQIRKRFSGIGIWVDRICINQADDRERSHQVQLTGMVYRRARTIFVWLGTDECIDRALVYLEGLSKGEKTWGDGHKFNNPGWNNCRILFHHGWWHRAW
jgi:hypothetical protein